MLLLTTATAQEIFTPSELFDYPSPIVESKGSNWGWAIFGFLLGSLIEIGANLGAMQPCVGQVADVAQSLYFSIFYIRYFIKNRGQEYISYVSVYISRGIESVTHGPCWSLNENADPSEQQLQAETFFSHIGKKALALTPRLKQSWESSVDEVDALAELAATTEKIA